MGDSARKYRALRSELNRLFDRWDPIGVYSGESPAPPGEYDCLAEVTLSG